MKACPYCAALPSEMHRPDCELLQEETSHQQFAGGAMRSKLQLPFYLIPTEGLELEAVRLAFGAAKYGTGNWCQGDKQFFIDCFNHMYEHMLRFRDGIPDDNIPSIETHLGAIRLNAGWIAWALKRGIVKPEDFNQGVRDAQ